MSNLEEYEAEQAEITAEWEARQAPYQPRPHAPDAPRWYVTMTWHNWPEGGSFGAIVQADCHDDAIHAVIWQMADHLDDQSEPEVYDPAALIDLWSDEWNNVDCFQMDRFLAEHAAPKHVVPAHNGHDPDELNTSRAEWAEVAVQAFMAETGSERHGAVSDLIADLMHLAHQRGENFADDLDRAFRHFFNETLEEPKWEI